MANIQEKLIEDIKKAIYENDNHAITGQALQDTLVKMSNVLGDNSFSDISKIATEIKGSNLNYNTNTLINNVDFSSFVIPNIGFDIISVEVAHYSSGDNVISYYSDEYISDDTKISHIESVGSGSSAALTRYISAVPNNCKMIIISTRITSNPSYSITAIGKFDYSTYTGLKYGVINSHGIENTSLKQIECFSDYYTIGYTSNFALINNPNNYNISLYFYDVNKVLISTTWFDYNKTFFTAPVNTYYYRISYRGTGVLTTKQVSIVPIDNNISKLDRSLLQNGYISDNGVNYLSDPSRVYFPMYIPVKANCISRVVINSDIVKTVTVYYYDSLMTFIGYSSWFSSSKNIVLDTKASYIRLSFGGENLQVSSLGESTISYSILPVVKNFQYRLDRYEVAHLFINDNIKGNFIIPSQSLFDIEIASKLGYRYIELNCHDTSDGYLVTIHGNSNKFGKQVISLDGTDISDVDINTVTLNYIKTNVRYNSSLDKYKTTIPTLEEACEYACSCGISIELGLNVSSDKIRLQAIDIAQRYFGNNFIIGTYNDKLNFLDAANNKLISNFTPTTNLDSIDTICQKYGPNYIHVLSNPETLTKSELLNILETIHKHGCLASFSAAYSQISNINRYLSYGFDFAAGCDNNIKEGHGELISNLTGYYTFDDFSHDGSVNNGVLSLLHDGSVSIKASINSCDICGVLIKIRFNGTLRFKVGSVDKSISSNGETLITVSSIVLNGIPTFKIQSSDSTSIFDLSVELYKY